MAKYNPCTVCGKPGLSGFLRGHGKCQYHHNAAVWGKEWADKIAAESELSNTTKTKES